MAEGRLNWIEPLMWLALGLSAGVQLVAQPAQYESLSSHSMPIQAAAGSLAGRLTDLYSAPLAGATVVLRNRITGAEASATTAKDGAFHFASLDAGEYELEADDPRLGHGSLDRVLITGGVKARIQAALEFKPALVATAARSQSAAPSAIAALPLAAPRPALSVAAPVQVAAIAYEPLRLFPAREREIPPQRFFPQASPSAERLALLSAQVLPRVETPQPSPSTLTLNQLQQQPASPTEASAGARTGGINSPDCLKKIHQGLKPWIDEPLCGTTQVVPFQKPMNATINPQPPARLLAARQRAPLETASPPPIELALATSPPHGLPLPSYFASTPSSYAAAASGLTVASLPGQPSMSAIATATKQAEPSTEAATTTVAAEQLQALPLGGRRWQAFLLNAPGSSAATDSEQPAYRASQEPAEISIDGASTSLAFGATAGAETAAENSDSEEQPGSANKSRSGGHGVSEAAVSEVTTAAGNAEAGQMRAAGGATNIRTEGGSNPLRGQVFLFDRQNSWGARNPFTKWTQNTGSVAAPSFVSSPYTPPDHEIVLGAGIGGRIRRNKLFWFAALDSNHRNDPGVATVKNASEFFYTPEPTSASVVLLASRLGESLNQAYNDYLGVPRSGLTSAGLEQLASLLGPAARTQARWTGFGRIDWLMAERHRLTLESTGENLNSPGGGLTRVSATEGNHSFGSRQASQQSLMARWEAYLSSNLQAVTQASVRRSIASAKPETPSDFEKSFLSGNSWGQLPQIVIDSSNGFTIGNLTRFGQGSYPDERSYQARQMMNWVHGKLLLRGGFEVDRHLDETSFLRNQTGSYHYSNVASFISDALAFEKYGYSDALDALYPHNCGATNTKWGSQPCYSYYSQTMGPANWRLSTNDWAGYATAQWQAKGFAVFSVGLRWEREQLPPPIAEVKNSDLPLTETLPSLGNNWGPRVGLAIGKRRGSLPVLRLGYGIYFGRVESATIETALTHTGSLNGDLDFFMRPSDDCQHCAGGAPPFPYVLAGEPTKAIAPGAVQFAPRFRNSEIHQAIASIEQPLPGHIELTAGAMFSLGRRLPVSMDANIDPAVNPGTITYAVKDYTGKGPIKATQITVPFYANWPSANCPSGAELNFNNQCGRLLGGYQQISQIESRANSTYEAATVNISRQGRRGPSFHAHYTYAHAMDWNPNESTESVGSEVLNPSSLSSEYGTSDLDVRHSATVMVVVEAPWRRYDFSGHFINGWSLASIGHFHSGLPYTMRTSGSLPERFTASGTAIAALGPGLNGSGGGNRIYGAGNDSIAYNIGRNTFRYPNAWKDDLRLTKRFSLNERSQLELMAESYNLFNHQNVTQLETAGYAIENSSTSGSYPSLCYLTINSSDNASCQSSSTTGVLTPAFGQPININATNFYRERQIQFGLRLRF